jgi:hypothetical protein
MKLNPRPINRTELTNIAGAIVSEINPDKKFDKKIAYNYTTSALARALGVPVGAYAGLWLDTVDVDYNPGYISGKTIEIWTSTDLSGSEWGVLKKLRLINLYKISANKCFYFDTDLTFKKTIPAVSTLAEPDHVLTNLRTTYNTGADNLHLSPIVICSHKANRMRGHLPYDIWQASLSKIRQSKHEKLVSRFIKSHGQKHKLK